jgi:ZIP family zinc transporter
LNLIDTQNYFFLTIYFLLIKEVIKTFYLSNIASITAAVALALGIGLQNFPEGVAVAMPIRSAGMSKLKSFWYGQLSAIVEPAAAVAGAYFVLSARPLLPYALCFAAGAMIYVVVEELIPESHSRGNTDIATIATMVGFTVMMILDVSLG